MSTGSVSSVGQSAQATSSGSDVFRDVGLLDPFFDHYCSDTDHQFRARRFGWRSVVAWHVYVHRETHSPRRPAWQQDQSKLKRRWG